MARERLEGIALYYLPRDRAAAADRGWVRLTAADFEWPMPGDAFWRAVGSPGGSEAPGQVVYRRHLSFYVADPPAYLIAVEGGASADGGSDRVAYMVQAGTQLHALTGDSNVIHALNERLGGPHEDAVLDYVEFFCSFVAGDEGPFVVPRSDPERDEVVARDPFAERARRLQEHLVLGDGGTARPQSHVAQAFPPARLGALPDSDLDAARAAAGSSGWNDVEQADFVRAHVIYGSAMFAATFAVASNGTIEMLDDDPLLALQTVTRHRFIEEGGVSWLVRDWSGRARRRMDAGEFIERVLEAGSRSTSGGSCPSFSHLEVTGDVVFPGCRSLPWLRCLDIDFTGSVVLDDCNAADRVDFESCRILGSFSARRAIFAKSLALHRCQVLALCGDGGRAASQERDRWGSREFGNPVAVCLDSAQIAVDLDLERTTCHASLRGRRLVVGGSTNLSGLRVLPTVVALTSVSTAQRGNGDRDAKFAASASPAQLDLSDSEFGGSVALNCALDHAAILQMRRFAPYCHRPVVIGVLRLDGTRIRGSLWIRGLGVLRPLNVRGDQHHVAQLTLRQARIDGGLQNYENLAHSMPPTRILGEVDLSFAEIGNYAQFDGFFITGDLGFGAVTAQSISLSAEWTFPAPAPDAEHGGAEPWFDYTGGRADATVAGWRPCYVGGNVNFNNARITGTVFVTGAWIDGTLAARDGARLGSLLFGPSVSLSTEPQPDGSALGLDRHPARVGVLELDTAEISGRVAVLDTEVSMRACVTNTRIAGDLDFYGTATLQRSIEGHLRAGYTWQDPKYPIAEFIEGRLGQAPPVTVVGARAALGQGTLDVTGCSIGGSLDLRNVRVQDDLRIEDTHIAGDVATARGATLGGPGQRLFQAFEGGQRAVSPLFDLEGCRAAVLEVHGECIDEAAEAGPSEDRGELSIRTECHRFVFDALHCRGDARLWRLRARRSISGRHAEIRGALSFFVPGDGVGPPPVRSDGSGERSVNLERANFEQLTIVEPFPPNVYLRGIRVGQWSPKSGLGAAMTDSQARKVDWAERADLMLKILDRMPDREIEPAVYLDVERYFRASGQDALADDIYCALRDRQAAEEERNCGSRQALRIWLAALALPVALLLALLLGLLDAERWLRAPAYGPVLLGMLCGLLAPWILVWANPTRERGPLTFRPGNAFPGMHGGPLRLAAMLAITLTLLLSGAARAFVTMAALSFWVHVALLMPALVASARVRTLVLGRLMLRLGTAWGTAPQRLVLVWLLLLLAPAAIVLHEPRNVEPTMMARGALKLGAAARPDSMTWRWDRLEAPPTWFWMAVESTVPIITIGAEDKWEAADSPPVILGCVARGGSDAACRDVFVPFGPSARQVETFLRLIGWIFWPLAAAGFAAAFIHRRQSSG